MTDLEKTVLGIELGSTRIKAALRRCLPILEKTAASTAFYYTETNRTGVIGVA